MLDLDFARRGHLAGDKLGGRFATAFAKVDDPEQVEAFMVAMRDQIDEATNTMAAAGVTDLRITMWRSAFLNAFEAHVWQWEAKERPPTIEEAFTILPSESVA